METTELLHLLLESAVLKSFSKYFVFYFFALPLHPNFLKLKVKN
jgi:hypothetical protein